MAELAVVTLTQGLRPQWLELCVDSVRRNLPPGATHYVLHCPDAVTYRKTKLEALRLGTYVTFVDDDDLVVNDGLRQCLGAIKSTNASVAFTDEILIDDTGNVIETLPIREAIYYKNIARSPRTLHHLAMLNSASVPLGLIRSLFEKAEKTSGLDWIVSASTALCGTAVHVPIHGSHWRQHGCNNNRLEALHFDKVHAAYSAVLQPLVNGKTKVPRLA